MNDYVKSTYDKCGVKIQNIWFAGYDDINKIKKDARNDKIDIIFLHGVDFNDTHSDWSEQYTLVSDLRETEEKLHEKISKTFKYDIRRAIKEEVKIRIFNSEEFILEEDLIDEFEKTYNQMYQDKGMNVSFNRKQMIEYLRTGCLIVSIGFYKDEPYVFHSYIYNSTNARLLHSTSSFRNDKEVAALIGRMNKAMHWNDLIKFKEMGVIYYDWGGISAKDAPNGIDQFKVSFGGDIKKYYNKIIGVSLKGKAIVAIKNIRNKH